METPAAPALPPELVEVCGGLSAAPDVVRHIGHAIMEPELGALISAPTATTCSGWDPRHTYHVLRTLENAGILETYVPDTTTRLPGGHWQISKARCFRPTERGAEIIPAQPPAECGLRNPLLRLTDNERQLLECGMCPLGGHFTTTKVASCRGLRNVPRIVLKLHNNGVLTRSVEDRKLFGGTHPPYVYSPTPETAAYLPPREAENCPARSRPVHDPMYDEEPLSGLNDRQRQVVDVITELHVLLTTDEDAPPIRQAAVARITRLGRKLVNVVFRNLISAGYLEARSRPGHTKIDHYELTSAGAQLLVARKSNRERSIIMEHCGPLMPPDQCQAVTARLQNLSVQQLEVLSVRVQGLAKRRVMTPDDVRRLMSAFFWNLDRSPDA